MTRDEIEKKVLEYMDKNPFTLAGFDRFEVELILSGYRKAFRAGYLSGRGDALEEAAKEAVHMSCGCYSGDTILALKSS